MNHLCRTIGMLPATYRLFKDLAVTTRLGNTYLIVQSLALLPPNFTEGRTRLIGAISGMMPPGANNCLVQKVALIFPKETPAILQAYDAVAKICRAERVNMALVVHDALILMLRKVGHAKIKQHVVGAYVAPMSAGTLARASKRLGVKDPHKVAIYVAKATHKVLVGMTSEQRAVLVSPWLDLLEQSLVTSPRLLMPPPRETVAPHKCSFGADMNRRVRALAVKHKTTMAAIVHHAHKLSKKKCKTV